MRKFKLIFIGLSFVISFTSFGASSSGGLGINVGAGLPFLTQAGINYVASQRFSFSLGYNLLSLDNGLASVKLSMPELLVHYHPFSGAFFIASGVGQESLEATSSDTSGNSVTLKVDASTFIGKLGWMWGAANGGFWFGIDYSFVSPSGGDPEITTTGSIATTSQSYLDVVEAGSDFGDTAYGNLTFLRFGYLF